MESGNGSGNGGANREHRRRMARSSGARSGSTMRVLRTAEVSVRVSGSDVPIPVKVTASQPRGLYAPDDTKQWWVTYGDQVATAACPGAVARVAKLADLVADVAARALLELEYLAQGERLTIEAMEMQAVRPLAPLACLVLVRCGGRDIRGAQFPDVWVHVPRALSKHIGPCGTCDACKKNLVHFVAEPD